LIAILVLWLSMHKRDFWMEKNWKITREYKFNRDLHLAKQTFSVCMARSQLWRKESFPTLIANNIYKNIPGSAVSDSKWSRSESRGKCHKQGAQQEKGLHHGRRCCGDQSVSDEESTNVAITQLGEPKGSDRSPLVAFSFVVGTCSVAMKCGYEMDDWRTMHRKVHSCFKIRSVSYIKHLLTHFYAHHCTSVRTTHWR